MLRTLLVPGKGGGFPRDTMLKPKQRLEALALEREVCAVFTTHARSAAPICVSFNPAQL
jgi:hypothetical protein